MVFKLRYIYIYTKASHMLWSEMMVCRGILDFSNDEGGSSIGGWREYGKNGERGSVIDGW